MRDTNERLEFFVGNPQSGMKHADFTQTYSLIIPAYNEEKRIKPFLQQLSDDLPKNWQIIIVCDGTDDTVDVARSVSQNFTILEFEERLGKGGAILEGFKAAKGDVIGYVDADGAIGTKEIKKVFSLVSEDTQVVIGSRWVNGSVIQTRQPISRVFLGRIYHYTAFAILGIRQKDPQCGLKAFSNQIVEELIQRVKISNFSVDTAFLYHCKLLGQRVIEVPVKWKDVEGSKVRSVREMFFMFATLVGLKLVHSPKASKIRKLITESGEMLDAL